MTSITRRRLLVSAGALGAGLLGARWLLPWAVATGDVAALDRETEDFVEGCFGDLDRRRIVDTHVHLVGVGAGGTGCWLNPAWSSHLHPLRRFKYELLLAAAGVEDAQDADQRYVQRLLERHRAAQPSGRVLLLALDAYVDERGQEQRRRSALYTPNDYVLDLAERHDEILAGVSIHPYRGDAVERLDAAAARGARAVKWLPSAMGIDPAAERCDPFYERLAQLGLPLITHAGRETTLGDDGDAELGNPLRLRRPLEHGVRVVVAHCGSGGEARDLDAGDGRSIACFDAFLRLFSEQRHERHLFADISGLTFLDRSGRPLAEMLAATQSHHRLVNGSDYPVCALDLATSTRWLELSGYLTARERVLCNRVADASPLLFDFVVKRSVAVHRGGRALRFSPSVFETDWLFDTGAARPSGEVPR